MHGTYKAAIAVSALLTIAACGSGTSNSVPSQSTTTSHITPPSSTSTPQKAETSALAAYRAMWQDFVVAGATSDWQSPKLGQHATGIALTKLTRGLHADATNGLVTKGEPVLNPNVSSVDPPSNPVKIMVTDCGDSTQWLKYRADNGQLADTPGGHRLINAIVEKQVDGSWKVSDFGVHDLGTC